MLLNLFIKNRITAVLILTAACGLAAWGYNYKSEGALFRKAVAVNSRSLAAPIGVDQPSPTITVFTAPGMSVAVTYAQVSKTGLAPEVNCAVMNNGGEDTDEVELLLLDFTAEGKIDGIVGRKFSASLKPRGARNLSFTTDRPLQSNHSLMLTVRAARGGSMAQEIDTLELLQGLIALRSGVTPTGLIVRDSARQQASTDPNFCHTVFRIAHNLTKGDGIPVAGYTCSQGQESFFIAYRNQRP
jgi:hypothetical protein